MKSTLYVEFGERQLAEKDIIAKAKALWKENGKKLSELASLNLYIKPEENTAYCVFNDDIKAEFPLD